MHREGHVGVALAAYAPVAFAATALGLDDLALFGAVATVALAMLPDVDMRIPLLPHRGPTHTVWFTFAIAAVGGLVGWTIGIDTSFPAAVGLAAFGVAVGGLTVGAHVLADALTPMGVRPLAPLSTRELSYSLARASNPVANYLLLALGVGLAVGAVALGRWVAAL